MKATMAAFFGFTLFFVGILAVVMGVWGIYSNNVVIGAVLLFGGGVAALGGAGLASMPAESQMQIPVAGNFLFALSFFISVLLLIFGMKSVFSDTLVSSYLMLVASAGAAFSAWSVVRRTRLG